MKKLKVIITSAFLLSVIMLNASCATTKNVEKASKNGSNNEMTNNETKQLPIDNEKPFIATYAADFLSIAPLADVSAQTKEVLRNMHDSVYKYDTNGELSLSLANKIDYVVDENFITFNIQLKDNIKFHNGNEITASDVKYSYERLAGLIPEIKEGEIKGGGYFPNLLNGDSEKGFQKGNIEVIDEKNLVAKFDDNYGILTTMHTLADGLIVPMDYTEEEQKENPIGAGAYKFVSYEEGNKISFERFDEFHGEKPEIKFVEFQKYADTSVLALAFQTGEIDMLNLDNENYQTIKDLNVYINEGLSNDVRTVFLNEKSDVLKDEKVRQAFHYGIDKEKINRVVKDGRGTVLYSHMTPFLSKYYNEEISTLYPVDKEKAKQLLAEANYAEGLKLTLKVVAEDRDSIDIATVMKSELEEVGIILTIDAVPWNTYYDDVYKGKNFDVALLNIVGYPDPSRVLSRYASDNSGNIGGYSNPKVDELLKQAYTSTDQEKDAVEKYKEVQKIIAQDAAAFWTIDIGSSTALSSEYKDYKNYPFAFKDISTIKYNK